MCCSPQKILQLVSAGLLCIAQPKCNVKAMRISTIVTMNSVCVDVNTCVCDCVFMCVCMHSMCMRKCVYLPQYDSEATSETMLQKIEKTQFQRGSQH